MFRLVAIAAVAVGVFLIVESAPDIARYVRMSRM